MNTPTEVWADISDGLYQVSNYGRVRNAKGLCLRPQLINSGYLTVHLYPGKGEKRKVRLVHRLVAEAFVPNPDDLPEVNHDDLDKTNNRATNLEWSTRLGNVAHAMASAKNYGGGARQSVVGTAADGSTVQYASMMAAEIALSRTGKQSGAINHCFDGRKKTAYGFEWSRA